MSKFEYGFIGWNNEANHDKIWGYFYRPTPDAAARYITKRHGWNTCTFWSKRGSAPRCKPDVTGYELEKLVDSKRKKGYIEIDETKLLQVWPSFVLDMEGKLIMEVLAGKVR